MTNTIVSALMISLASTLSAPPAIASPCSVEIAKFQQSMPHDAGGALPFNGTARQSVAAQLNRQPTMASVQRAEANAREQVVGALAQAQMLDTEGNESACMTAISRARLLLDP